VTITGGTPLHSAASADNPDEDVLILLNKHKTKTKAKDRYGKTPLDCADKNRKIR
jgi:ankyrin repeat protein